MTKLHNLIFAEWIAQCCFWLLPSYGLHPLIPFQPPSPVEWLEPGTATLATLSGNYRRTRSTTRGCSGRVFSPITEASFRWSRSLAKGGAECGTTFQLLEEDTLESFNQKPLNQKIDSQTCSSWMRRGKKWNGCNWKTHSKWDQLIMCIFECEHFSCQSFSLIPNFVWR